MPSLFEKDILAKKSYTVNWTKYLAKLGATIVTSTWIVPTGITKVGENKDDTRAKIWVSGGEAVRKIYTLENRIVASDGTEDSRRIRIKIVQS